MLCGSPRRGGRSEGEDVVVAAVVLHEANLLWGDGVIDVGEVGEAREQYGAEELAHPPGDTDAAVVTGV
jgi:hypothetical protein